MLVALGEADVDPVGSKRGGERFTVVVGRQARHERGRRAQPRQPNRDVIGRAAAHRIVTAVHVDDRDEINKRFAGY
jgi:hypothetical protein